MAQLTAPKAKLQVNEWNHVAFTLDVEKRRVELWVNKMNVASTAVDESLLPTFTNSTNLLLGSDGTSKFDGSMDDIIIYERTVSESELSAIMNNRNPELYLKSQLESYITFDRFRTNLDAGGIQIDSDVVVQGENVNEFSNKSLRIQSSNLEPISKSNDGMSTDNMSVGCWIKPLTVDAEDVEIVSKASVFSLGVKQGGEVSFSLGDDDSSDNQFLIEKEYRDLQIANTGSLRVPATAAARAQVTLSSGSYFANEFTVSMWFKVDEYATTRTLMSGMGFAKDNKALCVEDGILYMYDASNAIIAQVENILTDTWYHLVFTDASLILNYRKYDYLHTPIWSSNDILKLGNNFSNNKNFLGHIDEFVLYQKRLDFLSIFDLFKGRYPKEYESLVVVKYEFDDDATPGKDSSASQKDLTLTTATRESVPAFEFKTTRAPYKGKEGILRTHYDFVNEVKDTSGQDNDPLSKTAISFVESFNNVSYRAAEFDGTTSKIDCKPETLKDLDDGFTATTWIQLPEVLTPNTRYPVFAQEGVMMAWLQTDESLNVSSKVYISPNTEFMIKQAVWNQGSVDVTMSIKSVAADRVYYAALLLKQLDLSIPEDVETLNDAFIQQGIAPQSKATIEYTFSLTEARGIDGTMYPVSTVDNAYLYMRVVGDVYDLSSAKNVTLYQNVLPMFDSSVRNFVYTSTGPLHNFEGLTMTNSAVSYVTDTVFSEEKYVAEYTGKTSHNVNFTPSNDFVLDVVFKQTGGTTDRHSVLELVTSAGNVILYVAHADYWRFNYLPSSGSNAATEIYAQGSSSGMQPAFDEWVRHTYVFRKDTGNVEFYYNGVKGNVVAENAQTTIVEAGVFTMDGFNPFDAENTLKIGYGNQGDQTEGTRIASMDIILDDQAFPEFATPAEVRSQSYTPTYTLDYSSGTVANSFPTKSGTVQVLDPEGYRLGVVDSDPAMVKQVSYNPVNQTQVVFWEAYPLENPVTDMYVVLLHPDLVTPATSAPVGDGSITRGDYELHQFVLSNPTNAAVQRYNTSVSVETNYGQFSEFGSALTNMDGTTAPVDGDTQYVAKALLFDSSFAPVENVGYTPVGKQAILFQKNAFSTVEPFNLTHQDVWTVAFWYKTKATLTNTMYYAISWGSTSRRTIEFNTGGFNFRTGQDHGFDYNFVNDQWYHIAFTSTSGGIQKDTLTVYINGVVLPGTTGGTQNPSAYTLPSKFSIGMGVYNGSADDSQFSPVPYNSLMRNALLTDVMMFNSTLAAADIAAMHNNTFDPSTSSTIIMHLLPSSDALSVVDSTGNFTVEVHKYSPDVTMIVPYEPASDYGLTTAPNAVIFQNTPLSTIDGVLTSTTLAHRDEWSFSFWYKSTAAFQATNNDDGTIGNFASYIVQWKGDTSGHRAIELRDGKVNMRTGQAHEWNFEFEVGRWYHVAFTSTSGDIQANTLFFYVDGVLVPIASGGINTPNAYNFPSKLNIGYGNSAPQYNGTTYLMSDFLFYNTTLTPEEVNANFSQQQYTFGTKTPLLHYRFASESTKLQDSSGNGFDLEPTTDGNGIAPEIIPTFMENLQVPSGMVVTGFTNEPEIHQLTPSEQVASGVLFSSGGTLQLGNIPDSIENIVIRSSGFYSVGDHEVKHARGPAHYLFDGRYTRDGPSNGHHYDWHCNGQTDPWFVLDFGEERDVNILRLWRTGTLDGFKIKMSNDSSLTRTDVTSWDYDFLVDDFKAWRFVYNGESTPLSDKTAMKDYHSTVVESTSTMYSATSGYHELEITVPRGRYMLFMGDGYHAYGLIQMHILQETVPVKCDLVGKYTGTDAHTVSFTPPYDYLVDLTVNADSAQKVMDLKYGAETVSLNAADPWTLSGSFGEVSLEPFVDTWQSIRFEGEADTVNFPHHNDASIPNQIHTGIFFKNQYNTGAYGESETKNDYTITPNDGHFRGAFEYLVFESPQIGDQFRFAVKLDTVQAMEGDYAPFSFENHWSFDRLPQAPDYGYLPGSTTTEITDGTGLVSMGVYSRIKPTGQGSLATGATWGESSTGYVHYEFTLIPHANGDTTKFGFALRVHDGEGTDLANFEDISVYETTSAYPFGSINSSQGFTIGEPLIFRDCMYFTNDNRRVVGVATKTSLANPSITSIALNTMNRFTLVACAATDSMEVYHDGLPAVLTKVSGSTTVTDNSFTLGADPTAQEVTLVIGGDENGELLVESCDVVQSTQIITSFADPTYIAEKQWALTYTQPIALDNVTPADIVLGWGKFDNYLKSDGTKLETGIEVEMWKDYFQVPIENIWGAATWMIIKTIDGKYYGVGSNQYGQMGMPSADMTSMTDPDNVKDSYYFKVPVELTHFAAYDIKKMVVRQKSTMFLTTDGKLYGMGGTVEYSHFGTGENPTALYTITHLATDKVITDFSQSGSHTLILTTDNKLYNTGENRRCAIGDGTTTDRSTFVNVASAITNTEIVKSVYTTDHMQSGFLTESHKVFVCGWEYGNCYHMGNSDTNIASFTETGFSDGRKIKQFFMTPIRTWMVDESNDIYVGGNHYENTNGWPSGVFGPGGYTNGPTLIDSSINDGTEVLDILHQSTTGIVVVRAGGVYAFGKNDEGRLGNGDAVTTTTTTRAYKIADQHPVVAFITTGQGPYMLIGYRTMASIAPTLTDMDKITDVNTIGMGRGVTQDVLMGPAHLSDESTSNTSNSGRLTSGEVFDFFKMVNDNVDGGPMIGSLSNGDKVYFTGHVSAGAQLFEPYNTTGGNGLISQGRYTGQDLFGYTMPNVGHRYSGAVMYELGSSSRPKQMFMTGFKYRIRIHWGNGFRGDIYVFYRKSESGYDNFKFHEKVEHPSAIGNTATTEDLMLTNPTPAANAFLLVFVSNISNAWQELLRLQLFFNEPPPVVEYPKLPPYLFIDDAIVTEGSIEVIGGVYSEHANITKVYVAVFNEDFWSSDLPLSTIIEMIEGTGAPSNSKAIFTGPYERYTPTNIEATLTHATDGVGSSALISSEKEVFTCMIVFDDNGKVNMEMFTQVPPILTLNDRDIPPADILDKLIVSYSGAQFYGWGDFVNGTTSAYYGVVGIFSDSLTGVLTAGEGNAPSTFIIDLSWGTGKTYYVKEIGVSRGTNSGRYNTQLTISNEDDTNSVTHTLPVPQYPEVHEIYPVDKRYGIVKIRIHGSNSGNYHYLTKIALYSGV